MEGGSAASEPWVCIFSQPHRERLALGSLTEAGFEVYLPLYQKLVMRAGKRVPMRVPLFPRYLFARVGAGDAALATAYRMRGVSSFANRTLEQSLVPERIISAIRTRHNDEGDVELDVVRIKPGQLVKILDGPFAGLQAVFAEPDDRKRSFILLDLLGKSHRVKVANTVFEVAA
jgi:transcriptional antiterminator RfaH